MAKNDLSKKASSTREREDQIILPKVTKLPFHNKVAIGVGAGVVIVAAALFTIRVSYAQKIIPGVRAQGVYLGGLDKQSARSLLDKQTAQYLDRPIRAGGLDTTVKPSDISLQFNNADAVQAAFAVGHDGSMWQQFSDQLRFMLGYGQDNIARVSYDTDKVNSLYVSLARSLSTSVQDASLAVENDNLLAKPARIGTRVDIASFYDAFDGYIGTLNDEQLSIPTGTKTPFITSDQVSTLTSDAARYSAADITLTASGKKWVLDKKILTSWIAISAPIQNSSDYLNHYYRTTSQAHVDIDSLKINTYLGELAKQINVEAVDAQLTVTDGRATIFKTSQDGVTLKISESAQKIRDAITSSDGTKTVALEVTTKKAAVSDDTISQLGITDLLSEGVTYFPGSSYNRLTNIRVGQSKFNGVLIKPDQVFSFGAQMGPVGPEQGYLPGLVILNGHEENQYGGGMCQVSSTLFRAALLAGLPIVERHNHAFAVSFYTAPYGVPGVDATIYYPGVDLKIKNDTGHYILIQTEMKGTTLKFRLYGTKAKEGQLRGPTFLDGSNDATIPSTTVFYRDVVQNGQVVKTDTFTTHYKSSLDFPITAD